MNLYNNADNNINYSTLNITLRKINDTIYDSIIKRYDGYYCRIVCGYKPYDEKHNYGDNVVHNGLYMIYPLPQHEIKDFKLDGFTPPKLLDGNSIITVDSFNSTNPSEFTVKVPIDRRYMANREYLEGKNIFLEVREDRNHNKKIQVKEIYNDTNSIIGMQQNTSLTDNNTNRVTFYKKEIDDAKLKLLSIEGNTIQNSDNLSDIKSIGDKQENGSYKVNIKSTDNNDSNVTAILLPQPLRAINNNKDKLYLQDNKYFINSKIGCININDYSFTDKSSRETTLRFCLDINTLSSESTVISCLPYNTSCNSEDVTGIYITNAGRIVISIPLADLNNDISDINIKRYFNNKNPEILFVRKVPVITDVNVNNSILLPTYTNNTYVSLENEVKGNINLELYYDKYMTSLTISSDENHEQILDIKNIELPTAIAPNEAYVWDNYRKHYTLKKNIRKEFYQTFDSGSSFCKGYRYVKETMNGSDRNNGNHWYEIQVWSKGVNIARNPEVKITSSGSITNAKLIVDGNTGGSFFEPNTGLAWVQLDLGDYYPIDTIKTWHYWNDNRRYNDIKVECSINGIDWDVIYNNETPYNETSAGKTHILKNDVMITVNNNEAVFINDSDKILVTKQLINDYRVNFKNSSSTTIKTENIKMKYNAQSDSYFNVINKPTDATRAQFDITLEDELDIDKVMAVENFALTNPFYGRITNQNILVADPSTVTYYVYTNTDSFFDIYVKGGDILKIGCIQNHKAKPEDGDIVIGVTDYTSQITSEGTYVRINLKNIHPIRNTERILVINTNSIGTAESNPCTELFIIPDSTTLHKNTIFDEIEYFEDNNEIIEINYTKIKDHEEPYRDTLIINDWRINEAGEIEKTESGKAYSAIVLCKPKDNFIIEGNFDKCLYLFLDENKNPISQKRGASPRAINEIITTTDAPDGTQYCIFYLNSTGLLKEEDIILTIQSYDLSSEMNNYIKVDGNPTLALSAPYKKIRPLPAPTNIKSVDQKTSLIITWDEVLGAEDYIVYLEDQVLEIVKTNRLELFRELRGHISIKATNDITQSPLSERVFIHSVPRNPFIIHINNIYKNNKYYFDVTFKDNSELETGYKINYVIDEREEESIPVPGYEGTGTLVSGSFTTVAVDNRVRVRVLAVNEQGENEVAPYIEMRMPPDITWAYKEDTRQLAVSWLNIFPESSLYLLRYKEEDAELYSTENIINDYNEGSRITTYLPLEPNKSMSISLAATVREDLPHIFSKPIVCSASKDINLTAPSDFKSRKLENNQVEFSWIDNHAVEDGWELSTILNNNTSETIFIPSTTSQGTGSRQKYVYTFPEFGFMEAKLRMKWMLGVSRYTDSLTNYYFEVVNEPPSGIKRTYAYGNTIKFEWTPQNYVNRYIISIKKKTDSEFTTIYTTASEFYFDDFEEVDYIYNIQTEFLGEILSEPTQNYEFKPTKCSQTDIMAMTNKEEASSLLVEKTITKINDKYDLITRSITADTLVTYPINMFSTTQFTMTHGLISIETWGVGQVTTGPISSDISTRNTVFADEKINTVSYQETENITPLNTVIVTPDSNSYKIEMEINKTRIVCFGDSITAGHPGYWAESGTGDIEHSYPYWLDRRLKFKYEVINKGYGSDRTYDLLNRIDKDVIALNPQYCLIQIGTNDIYWGAASANGSMEAFEEILTNMKNNMKILVKKCMDNGIKPIIGLLIPRTQSVTDALVKHGLYSFNDWLIEYANTTEGLNYVDFFNAGKDAIPPTPLEDPDSPGAMNPIYDGDNIYDEMGNLVQYGAGIHLNRAGYKIMAEAIPLNLFNDFTTGLKMYIDKECTIEAEYNIDDKQNPYYKITVEAMQLTRTKKIIRYIKNVGIGQTLFAMYPTKTYNLKYTFQTDDMETPDETAYGILTPGKSVGIIMELTPQVEDSKAEFELSLVGREFSINS